MIARFNEAQTRQERTIQSFSNSEKTFILLLLLAMNEKLQKQGGSHQPANQLK